MSLKWIIFLVLTEIILKLLRRLNVIMIILMDWPITVGRQWQPDLMGIQTAMSKPKSTISKAINGTTLRIILLARKSLFVISAFSIYLLTLGAILVTLFHPRIKLRFLLEVKMVPQVLCQSLQNMTTMGGLFMEISKNADVLMDQ